METTEVKDSRQLVGFQVKRGQRPGFTLTGFSKIVASGGEQYGLVRSDGRWEILRKVGGPIYGVAASDEESPKDHYRYTMAVEAGASDYGDACSPKELYTIRVPECDWLIFQLEHFSRQYGQLWKADPYALVQKLGWSFNSRMGLHIDVYPPSYVSDDDPMEFWMPVISARG